MSYLTVDRYKILALIPGGYVDEVELASPGFTAAQIETISQWLDTQLRKRYAAPFLPPVPGIVEQWVTRIITPDLLAKRGVNATDEQFAYIVGRAESAEKEIQAAANSETGLYDLPLRADVAGSGIVYGGPHGYSEQSPYVYTDVQVDIGRMEDQARRGSGG
jgi:hypothetical protein